jgi:hypothetical protein
MDPHPIENAGFVLSQKGAIEAFLSAPSFSYPVNPEEDIVS